MTDGERIARITSQTMTLPPSLTILAYAKRIHENAVLAAFAAALSQRLGRAVHTLVRDGLTSYDFPGTAVVLVFEDRSVVRFESAFALRHEGVVGVFTEHCGYYSFSERSLISLETDGAAKVVIDG